jgi:hypothetical protein
MNGKLLTPDSTFHGNVQLDKLKHNQSLSEFNTEIPSYNFKTASCKE